MVTNFSSARAVVARGAALVSTVVASAASAVWAAAKSTAYFCVGCVGSCDLKKALADI